MKNNTSCRVSQMPKVVRDGSLAVKVADGDGNLDLDAVMDVLMDTRKNNKFLTKIICGLVAFVFVLVAAIFGVSIAAAKIAQDTNIDPITGFVTAKNGGVDGRPPPVMKTSEALRIEKGAVSVNEYTTDKLSALKKIDMNNGTLSFHVKGYSKGANVTMLLVEGGTLTFDDTGLIDATGNDLHLLFMNGVYHEDSSEQHDSGGRKLQTSVVIESVTFGNPSDGVVVTTIGDDTVASGWGVDFGTC